MKVLSQIQVFHGFNLPIFLFAGHSSMPGLPQLHLAERALTHSLKCLLRRKNTSLVVLQCHLYVPRPLRILYFSRHFPGLWVNFLFSSPFSFCNEYIKKTRWVVRVQRASLDRSLKWLARTVHSQLHHHCGSAAPWGRCSLTAVHSLPAAGAALHGWCHLRTTFRKNNLSFGFAIKN